MKIAFIGTGNMGGALARAVRAALPEAELYLSDRSREKAGALAEEIGAEVLDNVTAAERADYLFLGVKPQMLENLAKEIGGITSVRHNELTLVSMAAGVPIERINSLFGKNVPVIRIMPNTPVSVGKGLVLWCANGTVQTGGKQDFRAMLAKAGVLSELPEGLIDAGCALSGCGPAFVCLFLEAMADGAVTCGLPRAQAMEYAAQTLLGTAALLLDTGKHPGELKDAVCSPAGSTIAGVRALEMGAFRADVMNAVIAAFERTKELGN
jgi:pyrroline-5-carboxylate reductase